MKDAIDVIVTDFGTIRVNPTTKKRYEGFSRGKARIGGALAQKRAEEELVKDFSAIARYFFVMKGNVPTEL